MTLSTSAHVDTFARDNLPPAELWPTLELTTELLQYPDRLNAATEIIDIPAATWPQRPALRTPGGDEWTYGELQTHANQVAQVLAEDLGLVSGNRVLLRSPEQPARGRGLARHSQGRRHPGRDVLSAASP